MEPGKFRAAFSTPDAVVALSRQPLPIEFRNPRRDIELVVFGEPPRPERMIAVVPSRVMRAAKRNAGAIRCFLPEAMRAGVSGFNSASASAYAARLRAYEGEILPVPLRAHRRTRWKLSSTSFGPGDLDAGLEGPLHFVLVDPTFDLDGEVPAADTWSKLRTKTEVGDLCSASVEVVPWSFVFPATSMANLAQDSRRP